MKIFKGYTKNHHRPEASIVERYITKKVVEFCSNYLSEVECIGIPKSRHADRYESRGIKVKFDFNASRYSSSSTFVYIEQC